VINIGVGIPSPDVVNPQFTMDNLLGIIGHTREHLKDLDNILINYQTGVRTDRNRNIILERFLKQGVDYVLWLDCDMLYPHDIIVKYLEHDVDIMGCLYFKRTEPYDPVGYAPGSARGKYRPLNPVLIRPDTIYEVPGIGYGGMMVNTRVYEGLGDEKWTRYSDDFYMPGDVGQLTHDLMFCKTAIEHGFVVQLHGGVRPGHIGNRVVTEKDFIRTRSDVIEGTPPQRGKTLVVMPATDMDKAKRTADVLVKRSGAEFELLIVDNSSKSGRKGFVESFNVAVLSRPEFEQYVYLAQDAFPGRNWLRIALNSLGSSGVFGFNDGKWSGSLASFGLVTRGWIDENGYDYKDEKAPFFPGYHSHYADTELTIMAMQKGQYTFNPNAVLVEVDYEKDQKRVNGDDKRLYDKRKHNGFDGQVEDEKLLEKFA